MTGRLVTRLFVGPSAEKYVLGAELLRRKIPQVMPIYPESLCSIAFSPDSRLLVTVSNQGALSVWDTGTWQEVQTLALEKTGPLWVAFSPGGELVIPRSGQVRFLDPRSGEERFDLGDQEESPAVCVAFSNQGNRVAVAHKDRRIRLWGLANRKPTGDMLGHLDQISVLAFTPDGKTLASGSHDRTVKLWSVAAEMEVASLEAHHGKVHCLAFSPDGTTLVTGGETLEGRGEVFLWRAPRIQDK